MIRYTPIIPVEPSTVDAGSSSSTPISVSYSRLDQFTESLPFIIFFLVMVLLISMSFGSKALTYFLIVVLVSMLVFNQDKLKQLFETIKF